MPAPGVAVIRSVLTSRPGASFQALGQVPPTKSQWAVHARPAVGGPGLSYRYPCGSPSGLLGAAALGNPEAKAPRWRLNHG